MADCRPAEGAVWWVTPDGVSRARADLAVGDHLGFPEATVWSLLSRGYANERGTAVLAAAEGLATAEAEALWADCVRGWATAGWVAESGDG